MDNFSFKDFEHVRLRATCPITIGDRSIAEGEVITIFDKITIARLMENKAEVTARGGFDNRPHVFWTTLREATLNFSQGVMTPTQFSLVYNSKMLIVDENENVIVPYEENLESDENGNITLKYTPADAPWVYNKSTGARITNFSIDNNIITIEDHFLDVIVIYDYNYSSGLTCYKMGLRPIESFVTLEGRTRVKDDKTGQVKTGILKIPKLRLMSNLSITLGSAANPLVGDFSATAIPVGSRGNAYISEFYLLNTDIDSDI